ncbi:E3 ubiquitin-protein ligase TRIM39-like [Scleropages formosus]|uniref:E3 ubiquitin-protein ligase TRIM39-like n=1 Tax=Scleropages formosus TaxID=113540 RepID=A0A0P7V3D2_SCLFO|nr:E3 ubiquitin-protein ligase TRIM39-like [Scleropages formosus]
MAEFEMKSILKDRTLKMPQQRVRLDVSTQSHSIGAVRWTLPEEQVQVHSSAPSNPVRWSTGAASSRLQRSRQQGLRELRSLQECVDFIKQWKEQVEQLCQGTGDGAAWPGTSGQHSADPHAERSLEESRKLILHWAKELSNVDMLSRQSPCAQDGDPGGKVVEDGELLQQRVTEWAKEILAVSEDCGVPGEELAQRLRQLGLRKRNLVGLFPLLEFITWSLLKEDSKELIPQLWLTAKQRTWKSVWSWICSAAADVSLDPKTNHPWLLLSDDRKRVQEALNETQVPFSTQRFDAWPCVLGWEGFSSGRHYWEVSLANNGYWRLGVTTASSKKQGRFAMTPGSGYWVLWRSTRQFYACTQPETALPVGLVPHKVGVYVDYEEGQISFYNVDKKSHIFTFSDTFREKLYPLFAPLDGRTLITISSPSSGTTM